MHAYAKILDAKRSDWIIDPKEHQSYFDGLLISQPLKKFLEEYTSSIITLKGIGFNLKGYAKLNSFAKALELLVKEGYLVETGEVLYDQVPKYLEYKVNQSIASKLPLAAQVAIASNPLRTNFSDDVEIAEKLVQLHKSATKRNKDFNLTFAYLKQLLRRTTCYYTSVKLTYHDYTLPTHATIDRVDHTKGYVIGNIVVCSNRANQVKAQLFEDHISTTYVGIEFMTSMLKNMNKHKGV